jgi:hypothetical protein
MAGASETVPASFLGRSQGPSAPGKVDMVTKPVGKDTKEPAEPLR